jgi:hypothetical protein
MHQHNLRTASFDDSAKGAAKMATILQVQDSLLGIRVSIAGHGIMLQWFNRELLDPSIPISMCMSR